ncbi:MAG: low molecular weight protein arginine phosphatase [Clostridia bacterium]|nr:low molecular weight protein arginine phosphatase [Clostridia bacterium]
MHILFICTGNTCRSPMAEALLNHTSHINTASSAGMFVPYSSGASPHSITTMSSYGIDISGHRSRQVTDAMIKEADLILTMTEGHKKSLLTIFPHAAEKTKTLPEYAGLAGDIEDPFGGDEALYSSCAESILKCIKEAKL